jgi:hypothetical protein
MNINNKYICQIYGFIFRNWLYHSTHCPDTPAKVMAIKGWKTMRIKRPWGSIETITPHGPVYDFDFVISKPFKFGIEHLFYDWYIHVLHLGFLHISWYGKPFKEGK